MNRKEFLYKPGKTVRLMTLGRIILPLLITVFLFALTFFLILVPSVKNCLIDQKKELIRELSDSHCSITCSLLSEYNQRVISGELTLEDAQGRALKRIQNLRYGPHGEDYFWIIDMQAKLIMHPYLIDNKGSDQSGTAGQDDTPLFEEALKTAKQTGSGYVAHEWEKPGAQGDKRNKISYVKVFQPWGWIVGASVHVDDIYTKIKAITRQLAEISAVILFLVILLSLYVTWQALKIENQRNVVEKAHHMDMLRLKKLRELNQMAEASLEDLTRFSIEEAINLTQSRIGYLVLLSEDETQANLTVWSKTAKAQCAISSDVTVSGTNPMLPLWKEAVAKRKAVIVNEFGSKNNSSRTDKLPQGHIPILRYMTVPVIDGDSIVAVAGLANKNQKYDRSDIWQLNLLMDGMWKIIHRKRSETALKESEARYRLLTENVTDNIWTLQLSDMSLIYVSSSIESILGYTPEHMRTLGMKDYLTQESLENMTGIIAEELYRDGRTDVDPKRSFTTQLECLKENGTSIWTEITACFLRDESGFPNRVLGVTRDITKRRHLEQQLHHSQKMEAIGTLAGGIAHDFNNILSAIIGFTQLSEKECPKGSPLHNKLKKIYAASIRARDLVRHIMIFSRKQDVKREVASIVPILNECIHFIRASIPKNIDIIQDLGDSEHTIMADASQIQQILMNLCSNAAQSMKGRNGLIEIRMRPICIDNLETFQVKGLKPGTYLKLSIADSGCGIPEPIIHRIFEPFFTTKERGEGTGMGLSIVHGIIKNMGGAISVYSEPDRGTAFQIYLPVVHGDAKHTTGTDLLKNSGTGRILLVDDEEDIVTSTQELLEAMGYTVVGVRNGQEAFERFQANPQAFDLILTDMAMPRMTGMELSRQVLRIRRNIPIVICTGFSEGLTSTMVQRTGIFTMIMKPVIASELYEVLESALGNGRESPSGDTDMPVV